MASRSNVTETALVVPDTMAIQKVDTARIARVFSEGGVTGINPLLFDKIDVPNGLAWTVTVNGKARPAEHLDVVMVHYHPARLNYKDPYDPKAVVHPPPTCVSYDGITGHGDPGGACAQCPLSGFGGPCLPYYFSFLLFPDKVRPTRLGIPRTSRKAFDEWVNALVWEQAREPHEVYVRLGLRERGAGLQGSVVTFTTLGPLSDDLARITGEFRAMLRKNIQYPATGGTMEDPTRSPFTEPPKQTVQYHVCGEICRDDVHYQEDPTGKVRKVVVSMNDAGRLVLRAFTTERYVDYDDIPDDPTR